MKIIGMCFLLVGLGLLASSVLFNSNIEIDQMFFRGMTGIGSCIVGGWISVDSLTSSR